MLVELDEAQVQVQVLHVGHKVEGGEQHRGHHQQQQADELRGVHPRIEILKGGHMKTFFCIFCISTFIF